MNNHTYFHVRLNYVLYSDPDETGARFPYTYRTEGKVRAILDMNRFQSPAFQLELGKEGTKHWQMTVKVPKPMNKYKAGTLLGVERRIGEYCEPVTNLEGSLTYCRKTETRVLGPFEHTIYKIVEMNRIEHLMKITPISERIKKI